MTAPASSSSATPPPQNLAVLKAVVIILGVLFVVGFLALIAALVMRSSNAVNVDEAAPAGVLEPAAELSIALPPGAQNIVSSGGAHGLNVQFTVPVQPGVTHVWVIDPATGAVVSKIELIAGPAAD